VSFPLLAASTIACRSLNVVMPVSRNRYAAYATNPLFHHLVAGAGGNHLAAVSITADLARRILGARIMHEMNDLLTECLGFLAGTCCASPRLKKNLRGRGHYRASLRQRNMLVR